jgi:mannitol/fructose-specific phosphotransferase system IIA component (Ntr-type)
VIAEEVPMPADAPGDRPPDRPDTPVAHAMILQDLPEESGPAELAPALMARLADLGFIAPEDVPDCARAVLDREALGSTGIGHGVAFPVLRFSRMPESARLALAVVRPPVRFGALGGEPVDIFFLRPKPPRLTGDALRAGEWVSRLCKRAEFVAALREARSEDELWAVLHEWYEREPFPRLQRVKRGD